MWTSLPARSPGGAPASRHKHAAARLGRHLYVLGGRAGTLPLRDLWRYNLVDDTWEQLSTSGSPPPALQGHTAVARGSSLYVFGGELGYSSTETPIWALDVESMSWSKVRSTGAAPRGRRGHSALQQRDRMLLYGGYQDLRGSSSELWAFHFDTETWQLVPTSLAGGGAAPARHQHSAVLHDDQLWVFGGMHDLQERADLWRLDTRSRQWHLIRSKMGPGPLHSHAACRLPGAMLIFGGESNGHSCNDLWRFHFASEVWEKIHVPGIRPQPRTESIALAISELHLQEDPCNTPEGSCVRSRRQQRNLQSATLDRSARHSLHLPQNRISPSEKTYVFKASNVNYVDGSGNAQNGQTTGGGFLKEISKLSQINIARLSQNKCSYSVLTSNNDSTESLLRYHINGLKDEENWTVPPALINKCMVKSQSAHVINKRRLNSSNFTSPTDDGPLPKTPSERSEMNGHESRRSEMTREPISVPNFSDLTLTTPVLSPVEASKLVYLDSEEEEIYRNEEFELPFRDSIIHVKPASELSPDYAIVNKNFKSPIIDEDTHTYENVPKPVSILPKSASVRFQNYPDLEEVSDENISTSDYASIECVNKIVSARQSIVSVGENGDIKRLGQDSVEGDTEFGFCNPNYMGPDINMILSNNKHILNNGCHDTSKVQIAKLLNTPDSGIHDGTSKQMFLMEEMVELKDIQMPVRESSRKDSRANNSLRNPPKSLVIESPCSPCPNKDKVRAKSASRAERLKAEVKEEAEADTCFTSDIVVPIYVYVVGGKEKGHVPLFKKPISVWKFKFF